MTRNFKAATLSRGFGGPISLVKVRQTFDRPILRDIKRTTIAELESSGAPLRKGEEIAIAAGSRGIANIGEITRAVVDFVRGKGAKPFIIPAMGSHGGATAEGQKELLASFGITETAMGCEVRSSMEVVTLEAPGLEHGLYMDRQAFNSDGVILINRIKPHTDFHGRYESGLVKMSVIGLGKERQAFEMHRFGIRGLKELVPKAAEHVFATGKILLGIGIVENAYDETALIEAIPGEKILEREPALLEMARRNMPRLPVSDLDLLIVDQLGKNISGTGLDTNIIGRIRIASEPEPPEPRIKSIVVTRVTPESHGNATGIGLADVVTRELLEGIDFGATYTNLITSGFLERAKLPMVAETAADAVEIALRGAGCVHPGAERIVRIRDTLRLVECYVSNAVLEEIRGRPGLEVLGAPTGLTGTDGALQEF